MYIYFSLYIYNRTLKKNVGKLLQGLNRAGGGGGRFVVHVKVPSINHKTFSTVQTETAEWVFLRASKGKVKGKVSKQRT